MGLFAGWRIHDGGFGNGGRRGLAGRRWVVNIRSFCTCLYIFMFAERASAILAAKGITKHGGSIGGGKPPSAPTVIENAVSVRSKMSECK